MHQRELKKTSGHYGTIYEWQGHKARMERRFNNYVLTEITPPGRKEFINDAAPGWGAHGKAQSILTKWWTTPQGGHSR